MEKNFIYKQSTIPRCFTPLFLKRGIPGMNIKLIFIGFLFGFTTSAKAKFASPKTQTEKPVIINISDAVKPGKTFRINGDGFNDNDSLKVFLKANSDGRIIEKPNGNFVTAPVIQKDRNGQFLVAIMPENIRPGVYTVWVKNEKGLSKPVVLNKARPLFISEREVFKGLYIEISGRNFDAAEFGFQSTTKVRLHDGNNKTYLLPVKDINPYYLKFQINNEPVGKYYVEVSNDGGVNWSRLQNGQQLTVLPEPGKNVADYDPLNMGVAWASHFKWSQKYNVPFSDGHADMTSVVQSLINKAAASGGGIVYFSEGTYNISKLNLAENVVLMGKSKSSTIIQYAGKDKDFITCAGTAIHNGHVGLARLSIVVPSAIKERPDVFINLGQAAVWEAVTSLPKRTAKEMFVVDVDIRYDFTETLKEFRGLPVSSIGSERLYISGCDFKGFHLESHNYVSNYVTVKNNRFEFAQGVFIYTGNYLFLENNTITGHTEINREKHGFMIRANAYAYNNTVAHTGSSEDPLNENWNDGEALCNEIPGGAHNFGYISGATSNTVQIGKTFGPFTVPEISIYGERSVMIVHGKGLGQYRRVKNIDTVSRTISIESNWDIVPDSTSRFTLLDANDNITYYKNTIIDNPKGIWLFGNSIDCVVADNTSIDCDGVFIWSCLYTNDETAQYYFVPNYFNRVTGNIINGVSRKSRRAGIGDNATREGISNGAYFGVANYANEFRNNYISGIPVEQPLAGVTEAPAVAGIFVYATVHSSAYDGKNVAGDATNHIIENNVLRNLNAGINLSRCIYGQVIRNNNADSTVDMVINDSTHSQQTLIMPALADSGIVMGNQKCSIRLLDGRDALWEYRTDAGMQPMRMLSPVFELDGKAVKAHWEHIVKSKTDTLRNGVIRYTYTGDLVQDNQLQLSVVFQVAPDNPVVKFKYILAAKDARKFTKHDGKDHLIYFSLNLPAAGNVEELRLSDYSEKDHAYAINEYPINNAAFEDTSSVMGPVLLNTSSGYTQLLGYEHGSQYPNHFLEYQLSPNKNILLKAVKANYLNEQLLDDQHPYETIWFNVGATKGNVDSMASAYRQFVLHYISEYNASRSPYIFYNTWGRQERVKWAGGTYLSSMNLQYTLKEIEVAHKMGVEVYVLDMGWYEKTGDWNVNTKLFPDSLRQVKALLDKYGMKLGLWFNPTVASVSSQTLAKNKANRMMWNGEYDKPFPIWETEESVRLSLLSPYWKEYADKMIELAKELGVTYFKLDAVYQYAANGPGHFYGTEQNSMQERTESYAFQLPVYMSKIVERVQAAYPDVIFDFDVTEPERAVGLGFLSSGKFFMINNGPYFHSFDLAKEWGSPLPNGNAQLFTNPGPARGWFTRSIMRYDKWIPSILFLAHYQPDGDSASLDINLASAILGANGIWGELLKCTDYQINHTNEVLNKYKQVREDIVASNPVFSGMPGISPEVYEKINPGNGRGTVVVFTNAPGDYTYITNHYVADGTWHNENVTVSKDKKGHAVIKASFKKPGAKIIFFGVK